MRPLFGALLLSLVAWRAAVASVPASVAPAEGEPARRLVGGTMASLSWKGHAIPAQAREWEAFLSLDGGATFPIRLTPHLDLEVGSVRFRVPDYPTREGRLLLRFGNEVLETIVALPDRVTIEKGAGAPLPTRIALRPGEAARPGETGVIVWAEGDPDGGRQETYAAGIPETAMHGLSPAPARRRPQARGPRSSRLLTLRPETLGEEQLENPASEPDPPLPATLSPLPIRLLIGRQNE